MAISNKSGDRKKEPSRHVYNVRLLVAYLIKQIRILASLAQHDSASRMRYVQSRKLACIEKLSANKCTFLIAFAQFSYW